jgi:O-acetyl-ADP-ribose deacetylase
MITINNTSIEITEGDITEQSVDGIVNAANSSLMGGGGVDGAIHRAGGPAIKEECRKIIARIGHLDAGKAVITWDGNLPAKYVIHTVGPVWRGGRCNEPDLLRSAYQECLKLATSYKLGSIAFPSISTGAYGYPVEDAANTAVHSVIDYLLGNATPLKKIIFVLFDNGTFETYARVLEQNRKIG